MATTTHDHGAERTDGEATPPRPRVLAEGGTFRLEGISVSIENLERARRAGSTEADLRAAFPDLPPRAFEAIDAFLAQHSETARSWADLTAPVQEPHQDNGDGFDEELEGLLESHAELFRRLAR